MCVATIGCGRSQGHDIHGTWARRNETGGLTNTELWMFLNDGTMTQEGTVAEPSGSRSAQFILTGKYSLQGANLEVNLTRSRLTLMNGGTLENTRDNPIREGFDYTVKWEAPNRLSLIGQSDTVTLERAK